MRVIDRRLNSKNKNLPNRKKFLDRVRDTLRDVVKRHSQDRSVTDITSGEKVKIKRDKLSEPEFRHNQKTGKHRFVVVGNKDFVEEDLIEKPRRNGGSGRSGGDSGSGEDDFEFVLSRDEYLDILFEDLELPDLKNKMLKDVDSWASQRAGYSTTGSPNNLNVEQSMRRGIGRRIALGRKRKQERIDEIEEQLKQEIDKDVIKALLEELTSLKNKIRSIPFIDPIDLRYNAFAKVPQPKNAAVMFCILDTSGSMGEHEKDLAKRFFLLLHLFLRTKYKKVDIRFIRHHTEARECSEDEFFHARDNGGTIVSTALKLVNDIIAKDYPQSDWNIYVSQASDGDNFSNDNDEVVKLMLEQILPKSQYYFYLHLASEENQMFVTFNDTNLWTLYRDIKSDKLGMKRALHAKDIYPIFRELLESK